MARKLLLSVALFLSLTSFSQIREIPKEVDEAFYKQYPKAERAEFKDNLINVKVSFELEGDKYTATYSSKGLWRETEKEWHYDRLPVAVKDGFEKSKYADWQVKETMIIHRAGGTERYRLRAEKGDVKRKNLFFNDKGRLMEEALTI
jgi:hypothetical protein